MATFLEIAWNNFDFDEVIKILLSDEKSFSFHKGILFEALGAWVVAPYDNVLRQDGILMRARILIGKAEDDVKVTNPKNDLLEQHINIIKNVIGAKFYQEIYYQIGGFEAFSGSTSKVAQRDHITRHHKKQVISVVKLLELMHYHNLKNDDPNKFRKVTLNNCLSVFDKIHKTRIQLSANGTNGLGDIPYLKSKTVEKSIPNRHCTIALCYAASKVIINEEGKTLLDRFLDPHIGYKLYGDGLRLWLSYAAFIRQNVTSLVVNKNLNSVMNLNFQNAQEKEFSIPTLNDEEIYALGQLTRLNS